MNVLDLFSGIGGFSLGLERAGFTTVAFCEIDPYCRRVLRKHWPHVPIYDDVRTVTVDRLRADGIGCDVITAGFPCQDISQAGNREGLAGERSGLWREVARLVGELRPRYALLENVSALLNRGLGDVLGDLAEVGYDAEWHCIPAAAIGAPHRRDRVWVICSRHRMRHGLGLQLHSDQGEMPDTDGGRREVERLAKPCRLEGQPRSQFDGLREIRELGDTTGGPGHWWFFEPDVGRVANGVPARVDRLRCLGNAVVPQVVEVIGRAIMEAEKQALTTQAACV